MKKAKKATAKKATAKKATAKKAAAKKAAAKKAGASGTGAAKKPIPANTKGCCTIVYENKRAEQVPGVTKAECTRLARANGGVGQWNRGACA
jgi:hypothetical protein